MVSKMRLSMIGVLVLTLAGSLFALYTLSTTPGHRTSLWISVALVVAGVACGVAVVVLSPRRITGRVLEVTTSLGSTAAEMLAVASQVSAGAALTATSVSEAATTVEEVRQTSLVASQKATAVADSAQEAEKTVEEGIQVVSGAMEGLKAIAAQMSHAADCVVHLGEQTETISEIVAISNDIAEQSNVLSVNAAIEAAKAADAGKGFTVVAGEIKRLAEQSKQAVQQIRTILSEIEKGTEAAVSAAEQSRRMVEADMENAAHSHRTIQTLGENIGAASQLAMQIAISAREQLAGMDQISEVMVSIDQATAQNAAGAKQMESEVKHLQELAESLRGMVQLTAAQRAAQRAARETATEYMRQAMLGALEDGPAPQDSAS
jgi:methyl-accepting chemotaxis protein